MSTQKKRCGECGGVIEGGVVRPADQGTCQWQFNTITLNPVTTGSACSGEPNTPFYMTIACKCIACDGCIVPCAGLFRQYTLYSLDANCNRTLAYQANCIALSEFGENCAWSGTFTDCITLPPPTGGYALGNYELIYDIYSGGSIMNGQCFNGVLEVDNHQYLEKLAGNIWSHIGKPNNCP